jgi:hypothetical protein
MCLFHKWSEWEQYEVSGEVIPVGLLYPSNMLGKSFPIVVIRQQRVCLKCGKMQDELLIDNGTMKVP